jgi:hypothetical protein
LKVRDKEYLFDIGYDPRERRNMARKRQIFLPQCTRPQREFESHQR